MGHGVERGGCDHPRGEQQRVCEAARSEQQNSQQPRGEGGDGVISDAQKDDSDDLAHDANESHGCGDKQREDDEPGERECEIEAVMPQHLVGHLRPRPREIAHRLEDQNHGGDRAYQQRHDHAIGHGTEHQRIERPHDQTGFLSRKSRSNPRHSRPRPRGDSISARSVSA